VAVVEAVVVAAVVAVAVASVAVVSVAVAFAEVGDPYNQPGPKAVPDTRTRRKWSTSPFFKTGE
jgi:hypothetical protein